MSDIEHNKGTLMPVDMKGGMEKTAKRIMKENGWEKDEDTWIESLEDAGYREYLIYGGVIYAVACEEVEDYEDVFVAHPNPNGTISFTTKFYNGGCSFDEALCTALDNMEANDVCTDS